MARKSVGFTVISILAIVFLIQSCSSTKLLTKNVEEIQRITVVNLRNGNHISEIIQTENKDLIDTIYQTINTTKTRTVSENVSYDPYFTITLDPSNSFFTGLSIIELHLKPNIFFVHSKCVRLDKFIVLIDCLLACNIFGNINVNR